MTKHEARLTLKEACALIFAVESKMDIQKSKQEAITI